jgi:hypothetical protein
MVSFQTFTVLLLPPPMLQIRLQRRERDCNAGISVTGGGMLRARVGFSPSQDFINIFLLVLYIKKFINLD